MNTTQSLEQQTTEQSAGVLAARGSQLSFFSIISQKYGNYAVERLKVYAKNIEKLSSLAARKHFLIKCRRHNLFPKHIVNNIKCVYQLIEENTPFTAEIDRMVLSFKQRILNIEIRMSYWKHKKISEENIAIVNEFHGLSEARELFTTQQTAYKKMNDKSMDTVTKKFNELINAQCNANIGVNGADQWVINNTNVDVPQNVLMMYGLGQKLGIPVPADDIPVHRLLADVEYMLPLFESDNDRDMIRSDVNRLIKIAKANRNISHKNRFFTDGYEQCRKFKKEHPELIFVNSDKGNRTIIMHREDYMSKTEAMLSDLSVYQPIRNPTTRIQNENRRLLNRLLSAEYITITQRNWMNEPNPIAPRLYCLPKHHKPNLPLRPVTSFVGSPLYNTSKYVSGVLSKIGKANWCIKNSYDFVRLINGLTIPNGYGMHSFDVVSLFTNIPTDLVISTVDSRWHEICSHTTIPKQEFIEMLNLCQNNSYFLSGGNFYHQITGVPMGSPMSPIVAELAMDHILDLAITEVRRIFDIDITIIYKYVDDIFLCIPLGMDKEILSIFNSINTHIQFTSEIEIENKLPYLDVLLIRNEENQMIKTDWYMKPIASGRLVHYQSSHPTTQKMNTAFGLVHRVFELSDESFYQKNHTRVEQLLRMNGYPIKLIHRVINRFNEKKRQQLDRATTNNCSMTVLDSTRDNNNDPLPIYFSLLYVPGLSESIEKCFKKFNTGIKISFKNFQCMRRLFDTMKDKVEQGEQRHVIYKILCKSCDNKKCYIGTTEQLFKKRISNHKADVIRQDCDATALSRHAIMRNHSFDFDNPIILDRNNYDWKRKFMEELYIKGEANCVNIKSNEANRVSSIYTSLLK